MITKRAKSIVAGIAILATCGVFESRAHSQGMGGLRQACRGDYLQFCAGVRLGGGRVAGCLRSHASELSKECQGALQRAANGTPRTRDENRPLFGRPDTDTMGI